MDLQVAQERIAKLEAQVQSLEAQLVTDELTGILNRRGLMQRLETLAGEVRWQSQHPEKRRKVMVRCLSVLFIDIDHFKNVNNTYGHAAGDVVLKAVAGSIQEHVRALDIVGRYGGEEIVVGLVGADIKDATRVAELIRSYISDMEIKLTKGEAVQVTASIGVAEVTDENSLSVSLKQADDALYEAKATGRNRVVVASQRN